MPSTSRMISHPCRRTVRRLAAIAVLACAAHAGTAQAASLTTQYTPSTATFANPERGFLRQYSRCEDQPFNAARLAAHRAEAISLVRCVFYLPKTPNIDAQVTELDAQAARLRAAGMKMVLRFAYTRSTAGDDASSALVQQHLTRLTAVLQTNSDVIALMESGFVGAWGEGYYSQNFGDRGNVSAADWANRKAVVDKLLSILPAGRKVLVRTPRMKAQMYGAAPATSADVSAARDVARVGHHNDCFLSNEFDSGTYTPGQKDAEYAYLAQDTRYVPMGGETCGKEPGSTRAECPTALQELQLFHFSYVNADYHPDVLGGWATGGCMEQIRRQLGYRLTLVSVTAPTSVTRGSNLPFSMTVRNDGWSSPINSRPVQLVLRSRAPGNALYKLSLTNAGTWAAQATRTINHHGLQIAKTMPAGTYDMFLRLPDPSVSLAGKAEYAIRLANSGTWDATAGMNNLGRTLTVS